MPPAQQRLEARHRSVRKPHDRLVENLDLLLGQRLVQFGFQRYRIVRRGGSDHVRVNAGACPALPLGVGQRHFRIAEQVERVFYAARRHHAHAYRREHVAALEGKRRGASINQLRTHRVGAAARARKHQRKRIAAHTEYIGQSAEAFGQALRHANQHGIAALVAQARMDRLEAVDVDERERRVRKPLAQLLQIFHQRHAIAQTRQRVVQPAVRDGGFGFLARRHVRHQSEAAIGNSAVAHHRGAQFEPRKTSAFAAQTKFNAECEPRMPAIIRHRLLVDIAVVRMHSRKPRSLRNVLRSVL